MTSVRERQSRSDRPHPYLHGNFAPIDRVQTLTACTYTGSIPEELAGGEYVRNGGNPVTNHDLGRDAHWFDGDGMLSGVSFRRNKDGSIQPEFVNQYILTDAYLSAITTPSLRVPILPSIATLVNPATTLLTILLRVCRTLLLVLLSNLPGSKHTIKKISVANTGILYHDGRALATCESGPPMRVSLPGLETVGWFDGRRAEGEPPAEGIPGPGFGEEGILSFMKEWTTAHPRVDPVTNELILFHSTFIAPFVHYSIIPSTQHSSMSKTPRLINAPIPDIKSAKMMHDFGVSLTHTVIMDLPLSLDPLNLARNKPVVSYDPSGKSRFGVFSRWQPEAIRWFETSPCCIFHTANTWDETTPNPFTKTPQVTAVNLLACRLTSASLLFSSGNITPPIPNRKLYSSHISPAEEEEQCRLYYYRFPLSPSLHLPPPQTTAPSPITEQFALSTIPFEFPALHPSTSMHPARYIYGCSISSPSSTFGTALGRAVKIDCLVKMDVRSLLQRANLNPPTPITGCVDTRTVKEILASQDTEGEDKAGGDPDPIKIFKLPPGYFAQEPRFVPAHSHTGPTPPSSEEEHEGEGEDSGYLLSYIFNEHSQLTPSGHAKPDSYSELWIINAKNMKDVVCKVRLPQRVPYGLHGSWFSEREVMGQRVLSGGRGFANIGWNGASNYEHLDRGLWTRLRMWIMTLLG